MGGTTAKGDDIDVSFSDIIDNLDMAFMGVLQAQKGKWTLLADVIYLDVSAGQTSTANLIGQPVSANLDVGLKSWIVTAAAAYEVYETDTTRLNILGGGRYLYMDADLDFEIPAIPLREKYSDSGSVIDAIIGARGELRLNDTWYVNYHVDIAATFSAKLAALRCHESQVKEFNVADLESWLKKRCRILLKSASGCL